LKLRRDDRQVGDDVDRLGDQLATDRVDGGRGIEVVCSVGLVLLSLLGPVLDLEAVLGILDRLIPVMLRLGAVRPAGSLLQLVVERIGELFLIGSIAHYFFPSLSHFRRCHF